MRIVFITTEYPPEMVGGLGTYSKKVATNLAKLGHEVTVITSSLQERREPGNPEVIRVASGIYGYASDMSFFYKAAKLMPGADIYVCNDAHTAMIGLWLKQMGKKVAFILHRSCEQDSIHLGMLEKRMIREADISITISNLMKERYGCEIVVHNGCDSSHPDLGREHGLVISRNSPEKCLWKLERFRDFPIPIYVIGAGTESISYGSVIGLGFVDERKKAELISRAAFLLHPADFEPFGISILEAVYSGKPAVLLGNAGAEEIVPVFKGEEWPWKLASHPIKVKAPMRTWMDVAKDLEKVLKDAAGIP